MYFTISQHSPKPTDLASKINQYLSTDIEHVTDPLAWWHERRGRCPQLLRMALDYLTIPGEFLLDPLTFFLTNIFTATSIDVERLFSTGRLLLSHVRSRLLVQSTRVLLCLNTWSTLGLIKDSDVQKVAELQDIEGEDAKLEDGWDSIII